MPLTPQQRAARNYRRWSRRGFIPIQPPVRDLPDLPLPERTPTEQKVQDLFTAGIITRKERDRRCPGLKAKNILIDTLTGKRSQHSRYRYTLFDQLPRGLRDEINQDSVLDSAFDTLTRKSSNIPYIISQLRDLNRRTRRTVTLADL